eukprot:5010713-Prymnesium_polylepis.1
MHLWLQRVDIGRALPRGERPAGNGIAATREAWRGGSGSRSCGSAAAASTAAAAEGGGESGGGGQPGDNQRLEATANSAAQA